MAETESVKQDIGTENENTTQEERTFTQAEVDKMVKERVGKERARLFIRLLALSICMCRRIGTATFQAKQVVAVVYPIIVN